MENKTPNHLDIHIGHQLRLRRKLMGLSQADLGKLVGLTFQQIQKYENGKNSISARRLYDFARVLGVSPMYFYDAFGEVTTTVMDTLPTQAIHLVQDYSRIPSAKIRNSLAALVRAVAKEQSDGQ